MARTLIDSIRNSSLKNKIFVSTTAVILLISVLIALFTRWVLISTLTSELKQRGLGISSSIAESCRGYILTENLPQLTSLIFDARLGARKELVSYVFILNTEGNILAHTFTRPFPEEIMKANQVPPDANHSIRLLRAGRSDVYDVAVSVNEGIYRIGTVHVGLYKNHIEQLIGKLRTTFLGFVSVVTILCFVISHALSKYITRPITQLTSMSDEISRGRFDISLDLDPHIQGGGKDEVRQLASSFINMARHIKSSRAQLKESENKYRSLFASGPNPIFVLERESLRILSANPSAEETYGYSKEELTGLQFTRLGPLDLEKAKWAEAGRVSTISSKVAYTKKNGDPIYVNVHACPTAYQDKAALIVATTDISEMVEKDSQLIQASKMTTLGEMSAGIAHELNQPLNAMKMGSEYLDMMITKKTPIKEADLVLVMREISTQVDRAVEIIRRLRDFGRKADLTKEAIILNDPVNSVLDIIGRQLRLQNIEVDLQLKETLPPIMAHHNRMEQVVFNLLTNARDAINAREEVETDGGERRINISTDQKADDILLAVSDTGLGIDPAVRERMFEAFFTTKKMGEGMGLGLSITSEIVADYDGTITIDSQEGHGTVFTLSFPAAG